MFLSISCSPKTYTFQGKNVTKKQFDKKIKVYTDNFIKDNPQFVELWKDVEVVYDTTQVKN